LSPQTECKWTGPWSNKHVWFNYDNPAAEFFRQFILDVYRRKCAVFGGKIPSSAVAPALAELEEGLQALSETTYQHFGMGIRLTFKKPRSMNEKPLQPKTSQ